MNPIVINMVQGDTAPERTFTLVRTDGTIVDLTGATVIFNIYDPTTRVQTNSGHNTVTVQSPATAGNAVYVWNATDIPNAVVYKSKLRITYSNGEKESAIVLIMVEEDPALD